MERAERRRAGRRLEQDPRRGPQHRLHGRAAGRGPRPADMVPARDGALCGISSLRRFLGRARRDGQPETPQGSQEHRWPAPGGVRAHGVAERDLRRGGQQPAERQLRKEGHDPVVDVDHADVREKRKDHQHRADEQRDVGDDTPCPHDGGGHHWDNEPAQRGDAAVAEHGLEVELLPQACVGQHAGRDHRALGPRKKQQGAARQGREQPSRAHHRTPQPRPPVSKVVHP
mmetsp:Transcript_26462/g.70065  ORF Transcript_26462/g.70065 Transcript_26462/m.70065 type:complete len:229 (-) Transcript_26462:36-722(-)